MALLVQFLSKFILLLFILSCSNKASFNTAKLRYNEAEFSRKLGGLYYKKKAFTGCVEYFDSGQLVRLENYKEGLLHGEVLVYYKNAKLKERRVYRDGVKEGKHQKFWPSGKLLVEYNFKNGLAHGSSKSWFKNGMLSSAFNYTMGKENGSQKAWLEDGKYRTNYVVRDGRRYGLIGLKPCFKVSDRDSIL